MNSLASCIDLLKIKRHFADLLILCLSSLCVDMHISDCGFILEGLIKMPSAIWRMTAVGSQGVCGSGRTPAPCSGPSQFEHDFKRKVFLLSDLERAHAHTSCIMKAWLFIKKNINIYWRFQADMFNF